MPKGADRSKTFKKTVLEPREMPIIKPLSAANTDLSGLDAANSPSN